jgi:hypothetical protein
MKAKRILILEEYLQLAFINSKEIRSAIAHILWITDDRFIR